MAVILTRSDVPLLRHTIKVGGLKAQRRKDMKKAGIVAAAAAAMLLFGACGGKKTEGRKEIDEFFKSWEQCVKTAEKDVKTQSLESDTELLGQVLELVEKTSAIQKLPEWSAKDFARYMKLSERMDKLEAEAKGGETAKNGKAKKSKKGKAAKIPKKPNPDSDFRYDLNDTKDGVVITGYAGESSAIKIPDIIEGYPVTQIGDGVFSQDGEESYAYVYVPRTVTRVGESAFEGVGQVDVDLSVLTYIDNCAFKNAGVTSEKPVQKGCEFDVGWQEGGLFGITLDTSEHFKGATGLDLNMKQAIKDAGYKGDF